MLERRSDQALDATEGEAAGRAAAERAAARRSEAARSEQTRQARAPTGATSPAPAARLRAAPAAPQAAPALPAPAAAPDAVAPASRARASEGARREASQTPTPFPAGPSSTGPAGLAGLAARRIVDQWLAAAESGGWRLVPITGEQAADATPWLAEMAAAARGRWAPVEAPPVHDEEWQLTQAAAARGRVLWTAGAVTLCDTALRRCEQAALDEAMIRALRRTPTR
ncbi:MAG: hypothetical protein KIT17_11295 [Rubrivivax sp.]|nr:hypothetical protein [Rubrivivax sp.]